MRDALDRGLDQVASESIAWVEHFSEVAEGDEADPRVDEQGMVRDAVRYCGAARVNHLQRLTSTLRDKIGVLGDDAFECAGRRCVFSAVGNRCAGWE